MAWDTGFGYIGKGVGSLFQAGGHRQAASGLRGAAVRADEAAVLSEHSTRVRSIMAGREAYRIIGGQQADIAGAGFAMTGSALDLMRSSEQEAALTQALVSFQGAIEKNEFLSMAEQYRSQAAQQDSQASASTFGGILNIALGIGSLLFSDRRLKENIRAVGKAHNGLTVYSFTMKGSTQTQLGFLADEVREKFPDAVRGLGGADDFLMVDYARATENAHA